MCNLENNELYIISSDSSLKNKIYILSTAENDKPVKIIFEEDDQVLDSNNEYDLTLRWNQSFKRYDIHFGEIK